MPDDINTVISRVSEAIRVSNFERHEDAYEAAAQLRRAADQIENSARCQEARPRDDWWNDPDEADLISQR